MKCAIKIHQHVLNVGSIGYVFRNFLGTLHLGRSSIENCLLLWPNRRNKSSTEEINRWLGEINGQIKNSSPTINKFPIQEINSKAGI